MKTQESIKWINIIEDENIDTLIEQIWIGIMLGRDGRAC